MEVKSAGRRVATLTALVTIAGLGLASSAGADEVTDGELDWGFKSSFQNYVMNVPPPVPPSSITVGTPATASGTVPSQVYSFPGATGLYDPGTTEIDAAFDGSVRFQKPAHVIDIELTELRLSVTGDTGVVVSDVVSSGTLHDDAELATLDLSGIMPSDDGSVVTYTAVPATGTDDNVVIFGQYGSDTPMDPVTFSLSYEESDLAGPVIASIAKAQKVGRSGKLRIARIACGGAPCEVDVPAKARIRLGGRQRKFRLSAPEALDPGQATAVRGKMRARIAERLTRRKRKVRVPIAVRAGAVEVQRTVVVKVRAK